MHVAALLRPRIKAARKRGAAWVRLLDVARLLARAVGRSILWTQLLHREAVHQTTADTADERYPELFDLAARLAPGARRILSFGCSTGQELLALRRRFPEAEIVGAEINGRSRALARRRIASDERTAVVPPTAIEGPFDIIFALAVFQREPHKVDEMEVEDLSPFYPFARFDAGVSRLVGQLSDDGLLCVFNAQYRVEDSSAADQLEAVADSPLMAGGFFGPDGRRVGRASARTIFRKVKR